MYHGPPVLYEQKLNEFVLSVPSNRSCCLPRPSFVFPLSHPRAMVAKTPKAAPANKSVVQKKKDDTIGKQAQCFRNLMKYKASDTCKKAGTVLGSQGLSIHIAKVR